VNAAKGLTDVLRTNLGPKGTIKMLVGGAGDVKLTKDGNILLREMQIQNPTAVMIARTAVAQDDITGDGTTSTVLMIGELMKQAERYLNEGVHPRVLCDGFEVAKKVALEYLQSVKKEIAAKTDGPLDAVDRESLLCVARTSLRTKVHEKLADMLAPIVTDACLCVRQAGQPLDLYMVETLHMKQKLDMDTSLIKGLVLDHGSRHPDMKQHARNCWILTCNISLEYEKSEVNSGFFYSNADQREKLAAAERKYTDDRVEKVIELKRKVCTDPDQNFVVINQKGIDPFSLDMLAKEGIIALRRAKKRNMERLVLACGGRAINSVEELVPEALGYAGLVYEHEMGDDKFTFVEETRNPQSCTILIKGSNDYMIAQTKEAIRDGLRSVKNVFDDGCVVPGAGCFEVGCERHVMTHGRKLASGKAKLGVEAFANAMLVVPKALCENSGLDAQDSVIKVQEAHDAGVPSGIDLATGDPMDPNVTGVYDNFKVKQQILFSAPVIASQLLLVDEVIRAGHNMRKG